MKNLAVALIVSAQAFTTKAKSLQTKTSSSWTQPTSLPCNKKTLTSAHRPISIIAFLAKNAGLYAILALTQTAGDECIEHAYFDTDEGKCYCNRTLKHWAVTNKCYQPELCENEIIFSLLIIQVFNMFWLKASN